MTDEGISNLYIDQLMKQISSSFRGTFSCNTIPYFNDQNFSIIVNLSKDNEKGSHLISLFFLKNKIIYFDPYGLKSNNTYINKYLSKYNKKIVYSKSQIQDILSNHCGFFCISFILFTENSHPLKVFLSIFNNNNLLCNDYICIEMIKYYIKLACI